ncbi:hypothetical protein SAMN05216312_102401 [Cohnella sp. OV330]|uniref:hypothetical protein n=1 Tax=Cohnella sp. OV330 TaxID=1855288 RepID=UPI0008E9E5E3|nr:hypothetical protein [Cohnella sp. OV330]SFA94164.1 hypothetical protein SAMN05216312_102401 [Cohnella sp. OV330]
MEYRKFMRGSVPEFPRGTRFPERLALRSGDEETELSWLQHTASGAVVFVMSAGCEACDLDAAVGFMEERPELDYLLLAEASEAEHELLAKELAPFPCRVERCEISAVAERTPIKIIPFMIVLDRDGFAVGSGLFNTTLDAAAHARSLGANGRAVEAGV